MHSSDMGYVSREVSLFALALYTSVQSSSKVGLHGHLLELCRSALCELPGHLSLSPF
jgi:hypothetical protein